MQKINLRELYPDVYKTDVFVDVAEEVLAAIRGQEQDDAAYELRLRSLLSEIGSLSWKGPSRSWSAVLPRTPRTETSALRRCATSCTPTTPSLSRPRTLRRRAA